MYESDDRQKYADRMMIIRYRFEVIDRLLSKKFTLGYEIPDAETVCLQFRKIFELIVMSSLCANRDKYQQAKSRFDKEWRAKTILRFVESLNPHFYPVPIRRSFFQDGSGGGTIEHLSDGFLTRDELSAAHGKCGELLHADNPYRPATTDLSEWHRRFQDWRDKTMTLLRLHTIQLVDQEYQWWVVMRFGSTEPVQVALFQRVDTKTVGKADIGDPDG